jgi:hypothetical protein
LLAKPAPRNVNLGSDRFAMFNKMRDIPEVPGGMELGMILSMIESGD